MDFDTIKYINQLMLEMLDSFFMGNEWVDEEIKYIVELNILCEKIGYVVDETESADKYDFMMFRELIYHILMRDKNIDILQQQYYSYRKAMYTDVILDHLPKIEKLQKSLINEQRESIGCALLDRKKVYLDYNIYVICEEKKEINNSINKKKKNMQFLYSPAHLEEVYKRENEANHSSIISLINQITDRTGIFREVDHLDIMKEDARKSYDRIVYMGKELNMAIEQYRLRVNMDKDIYNPEYYNQKHTAYINSTDILDDEKASGIFDEAVRRYGANLGIKDYESIGKTIDLLNNYTLLNSYIYSLMNGLMLIKYKADKGEKRIRSSVYDIEHIIYASKANQFVTTDTRLAARAIIVYKILNIDVDVLNLDEFLK